MRIRAPWLGVPVEPDAEEARRWAEEELSRDVYDQEPTLLERAWQWFVDLLDSIFATDIPAPPNLVPVIVVLGVAALLAVVIYLAGPLRTRRRTGQASHAVFDDPDATSADLTQSADAAAASGDWSLAVLMRFRAIIRSLDERAILEDRPGITAHEASTAAAAALPECAAGLHWAGQLFDDVRYGDSRPGQDEDAHLRELAAQVAAARVAQPAPAAAGWGNVS